MAHDPVANLRQFVAGLLDLEQVVLVGLLVHPELVEVLGKLPSRSLEIQHIPAGGFPVTLHQTRLDRGLQPFHARFVAPPPGGPRRLRRMSGSRPDRHGLHAVPTARSYSSCMIATGSAAQKKSTSLLSWP